MILFGHPISPYVRKARLALALSGIEHDFRIVMPHADDPEFRAASPVGKIPAMQDGEHAFADSSVIVQYLHKFKGANLIPDTPTEFLKTLWLEEYADTVMTTAIGGHLFAERVLAERLFNRKPIQSDIDKALNDELPRIYTALEKELGGNEWLAGTKAPSLADIAVGAIMISLYHCGEKAPDSAPNLAAWMQRFLSLDEVANLVRGDVKVLQQIGYESALA